ARDKCHAEKPPLVEAAPGHSYACWYPLTAAGNGKAGGPAGASATVPAAADGAGGEQRQQVTP
ncbi:MAG TPA: hypothetical protein VEH82_09245, partial [Acidimicrobiales bacterium]|nr:hypothetical protein [Acidimicrobiales bacterium]